jgi:hypothetical protein
MELSQSYYKPNTESSSHERNGFHGKSGNMQNLTRRDLLWLIPLALVLGAILSSLQPGNWLLGFLSFSFLFFLSLISLQFSYHWAASSSLSTGKALGLIISLAFALRLLVGVSLYLGLPIYGHEDEDDKAGYVFTDAHRRDDQAWGLASSDRPILDAFTNKFAYDQYGGLLAFSAFVYRYFSPDAHRPLMLVLLSAFVGALGVPFLWKVASHIFGERVAYASAWIFALYPESVLLGSSAMREPYLLAFSAMAFWGFVDWNGASGLDTWRLGATTRPASLSTSIWLAIGLLGMLLVSPAIAIATLVLFAGWFFFSNERGNISWRAILIFSVVFIIGLFFLSSSLNRSGEFDSTSPFHVINDWLRLAVKWDAYRLERESGWVQKLFDEMPSWLRLPFVAGYGIFQPVLPAAVIHPTKPIWRIIQILRALGWYAILPMLVISIFVAARSMSTRERNLLLWISLLTWTWILLAALRGGGDQWDNPRYRTLMFLWQSILAGYVWVWWRETRNVWLTRVILMEGAFLLVFTQWYANRYYHWGGQLPFAAMVALIVVLWGVILGVGWWWDRRRDERA